ncbi:MAG TPA: MMPL family transporter [Polyangia bacterium]|nr:MMPL family transporter [Polyangia bacterium]
MVARPTVARTLARLAARPRLVLGVTLLVAVAAAGLASRLTLRTSLVELLPTRDPAVVNLERTQSRVGDMNLLLVGIRSPDRAANLRYAAAITERLRSLPPSVCQLAAHDVRDVRAFFHDHRWLYASQSQLEELRDRLRAELLRRKNPMFVDLDDGPPATAAVTPTDDMLAALDRRFPDGDFVRGDYAWVAALPPGGMLSENAGQTLLAAVRAFIAENPPQAFHPAMQVMPAGPVVEALRNREAVEHDVVAVTVACLLIITLSIALYFRSLRVLPLVAAPALAGTLVAFAAAALAFGYLNSSTAFLGSIILGNGINHAIVLLARIREHEPSDPSSEDVLTTAIDGVWRSTLAAALAAAAAYASLTLTSFRGFSQFGLMGAVGSLGCWAATFLILPATWRRFGATTAMKRRHALASACPSPVPRRRGLHWLVRRHHRALLLGSLLLTAGAVAGLGHFLGAPFEYDFRKLSTRLDSDSTYRAFDSNMDALFGRWHTPIVLLADQQQQVEPMRRAIRAADNPGRPFIGQIVTVNDFLPGSLDQQQRKLAVLADIRRLAGDPAVEHLSPSQRQRLRANLPPADLRPLLPSDLPPLARRPFTEVDGTVGRPLLVYHAQKNVSMWNGRDLLGIAGVLESLRLDDGTVIRSSGAPMIFGAMLRSILNDGPRATGLALLGVLLVVGLMMRPLPHAALALGTMLTGVVWMIGAAGLAGVRITFLNFIALPITFGIGVEYAVNIAARLRAGPATATGAAAATASTSGAVALCSWTTIVGYGSLLAARSQALRGFGALAILGELACLAAALLLLPAAVKALRAFSSSAAQAKPLTHERHQAGRRRDAARAGRADRAGRRRSEFVPRPRL